MKSVVDLIREFSELNDEKSRNDGTLPGEDEARWAELKEVYELLVFHSELGRGLDGKPYSPEELRACLSDDTQLRVPVDAHAMVQDGDDSFDANVVNLSRSGSFLASDTVRDVGTRLTVYITEISEDDSGDVFELDAEVIWCAEEGIPEAGIRQGIGIRFLDVPDDTRLRLGTLVVTTIEKRLAHSSTRSSASPPT